MLSTAQEVGVLLYSGMPNIKFMKNQSCQTKLLIPNI